MKVRELTSQYKKRNRTLNLLIIISSIAILIFMALYAISGSTIVGVIATISLFIGILFIPFIIMIAIYQKKSKRILDIDNALIQKAILNTKSKVSDLKGKEAILFTGNYLLFIDKETQQEKKIEIDNHDAFRTLNYTDHIECKFTDSKFLEIPSKELFDGIMDIFKPY